MSKEEKVKETAKPISKEEIEKEIVRLAETGLTAPKIGEKLREKGIHTKDAEIKISQVLKKNNLYELPDLKYVSKKLEKVTKHLEKNKQDKRAVREKSRIFSALRKLKIYHKQ